MTIAIIFFVIVLQIFLSAKKVSPFISLLIVAILAGILLGMQPADLLKTIEKGVSNTLGGLTLVICLGAMFGKILEETGAAAQISNTLVHSFGKQYIQWAVLLASFLVGIPLFYNAGFVIMVPLLFSIAKKANLPLLYIAIPMAAGLSVTHCFLPPHPSPVVLVNAFGANMGKVLLYGLAIGLPAVVIAGPIFGSIFKNGLVANPVIDTPQLNTHQQILPSKLLSFIMALVPIFLISVSVLCHQFLPADSLTRNLFLFVGDTTIALLIATLLAAYFLGIKNKQTIATITTWCSSAVSGIAMILLIITAGGIFKQVLIDSGTANYITTASGGLHIPPLLFGWLVTAMLRVTIGSASVAGITAAGIVTPLIASGAASPELMVLAIGSGSVFGSHVNDSGFWMFKEFFGLTLKQTFLSWTLMETIISVTGLIGTLLLSKFM
jgi:Gnt-I system high-affinity gluconate transporter